MLFFNESEESWKKPSSLYCGLGSIWLTGSTAAVVSLFTQLHFELKVHLQKCKNLVKMICIQPQFAACLLTNIQYISYSLADHFHPFLAFPPFVCVALGPGWAGQPVDILLGDPKVSPGQKRYISQQRVLGLPWGPLPVGPSPPLRHMQQASW